MTYEIVHKTIYTYTQPVSLSAHVAYVMPRSQLHQTCTSHQLVVTPEPASISQRTDYFGNSFSLFAIQEGHKELIIEARSRVFNNGPPVKWPEPSPAWDDVVRSLPTDLSAAGLDAYQFVFESPRVPLAAQFAAYAGRSFLPARPLTEALLDFTNGIYKDFSFDSKATDVKTSPLEVLRLKKGVCQDFAHLGVACLRSLGLAARYVSGYIRTYPPPGRPRLIGADASHAWLSVYCPGTGWLDIDPTNNSIPAEGHVTLAWGRDYGDVSPVRGVILGGRDHKLDVGVDMAPLTDVAS